MKRYLFVIVMLISMYSLSAQNALWNQVAELEKQSLPKSALEVVNRIYAEARAKGDGPELIKALIYQLKYETAIDQDRLPDWILEIETLAQKDTRPAEQAVLYSYLSELYSLYYQAHNYDINQRTAIQADSDTDFPADLREWTGNLFIRKIVDSAQRSIAPAKILQADDALQYKTILTEGESSRKLRPTLYDLLMYRAIDRLNNLAQNRQTQNYFPQTKLSDPADFEPVKTFVNLPVTAEKYNLVPQILNLYQQLLAFRLQTASGNQDLALLMVDLDRLDFVYHQTQTDAAEKNYLDALNTLKQQYASSEYCVEILYKEVLYYYANQQEKEQQEKIYALCREGIEKYPNYNRIGLLQNVCNQVTQGYWEAQSESVVYPGHDLELSLNYRNLSQLTIEIYRIQAEASAYLSSSASLYRNQGRLVETKKIDLTSPLPYEIYDTIIKIPMKELGIYEYVIYADSKKLDIVNKPFSVSRLAAIARTTDGKREFLVTDRLTGKPVEGAQIHLYKRNRNNSEQSAVQTVTTNALGLAVSDGDINMEYYTASFQEDTALLLSGTPWISNYRQKENTRQTLNLFTDRSLYRPGQTVYFKGIAYELGKNVQHAIPDKSYTLTLYDPNYKEIAKKTFKTNAFGSISGEFVIPQGLLNGYFLLQSDPDGASAGIQVEEYKRPTFDIRFDPNEQTYSLGDQVVVKGKVQTFSGINLQNAEVQYRITRQDHWLLGRMMRRNPVQTAEGQVQTNNDGSFSLTFPADRAFEDKERKNVYYTYTIEASVSDTNGETQSAQTSMAIGEKSMYLTIEGLQEVNAKEKLPDIRIDAWNLNARPVTAKGTYSIYKLKSNRPDVLDAPSGDWTTDQKVFSGDFESAKPIAIAAMKSWASGRYRMVVQSKDDQEREVEAQQDFTLASTQDKRPPVPVSEWIMQTKTECAVGETAEIIYGSAAKNVYVLYEIFQNDKKISASRFVLNNENRKITIPFLESYGDGISACFTFIKDKKVHFETVLITKKQPDESLTLQMEVFRDRLLPGQSEEWKISVKNADKKPVSAEILAAMYDASLDKIKEHNWYFNPSRSLSLATPYWQSEDIVNILHDSRSLPEKNVNYPAFTFDTFNWFGWNISYPMLRGGIRNSMSYSKASGMDVADIAEDEMIAESAVMDRANAVPAPKAKAASQTEEAAESPVQIRQNFNETSFFYPQLKTNEAGETLIAFTVPESNTTWKFMGLAHTKDLKFGQIMKEAIS
ncbi:MAG: hypothetical protein LBN18_00510, partial [Dysgonamonadaceae bacterium]|nr:hypothetical protein [Dysgonamonadaceae bacterium]